VNLIGFLYLFDIFIGGTIHMLKLFLHRQGFVGLDISFLLEALIASDNWLSSCST
jgi:hypothetical protein